MNDFFASLFELWGVNMSGISDSLYEYNIYATTGLVWFIIGLGIPLIYYKAIDHPRWSKPKHWFTLTLITSALISSFGFFYAYRTFTFEDLGYRFEEYIQFALTVFIFSLLFIFLFSIVIKRWSKSMSKTPF